MLALVHSTPLVYALAGPRPVLPSICTVSTTTRRVTLFGMAVDHGAAFARLDKNKDGFLDREELLQLFRNVGEPLTPTELEQRMAEADLDGDASSTFSNLRASCSGRNLQLEIMAFVPSATMARTSATRRFRQTASVPPLRTFAVSSRPSVGQSDTAMPPR